MWFDAFRSEGFPTHYNDQHTAAHVDILTAGLILSFVILGLCVVIVLPAYRGVSNKLKILLQTTVTLFIGGVIVLGNFGHEWEVAHVKIASPYKAATAEEIHGELGLYISLRGINITLTGHPKDNTSVDLINETIDYNEHFSWTWGQGRFGFGYYAGQISRDFRAAVLRGSPWPILQVAEYFTFDGEGLRFGRYYRWAGWYAHFLMWAALPVWAISTLLFRLAVKKASVSLIIGGLLQLTAILVWSILRNPLEIQIPFEAHNSEEGEGEVMLRTKYGKDYYLVLFNSVLCITIGIGVIILNFFFPDELCRFFDIDPLTLYEDVVSTAEELDQNLPDNDNKPLMPPPRPSLAASDLSLDYIQPTPDYVNLTSHRRRKSTYLRKGGRPNLKQVAVPIPTMDFPMSYIKPGTVASARNTFEEKQQQSSSAPVLKGLKQY